MDIIINLNIKISVPLRYSSSKICLCFCLCRELKVAFDVVLLIRIMQISYGLNQAKPIFLLCCSETMNSRSYQSEDITMPLILCINSFVKYPTSYGARHSQEFVCHTI